MAKNGKGKLIIGIVSVSLLALGMIAAGILAYGDTAAKADTNAKAIDHVVAMQNKDQLEVDKEIEELDRNKVEKEMFKMHLEQQNQQFQAVQQSIQVGQQVTKDGFDRMDKRLERIEAK